MDSNLTLCMESSLHAINDLQCFVSRILGSILISVALFSATFNLRFLFWSLNHGRNRSRQNLFIFSMIFSSMLVTGVIVPSVVLQSFACRRLCSPFYCQLEGFISYLNGCVHIFMLMMISIIRYVTVLHGNAAKLRFRRNSNLAVVISWLLGLVFAVPPLFKWNRFIPEGLGFHCGLNWSDRSTSSHIYLFSTMLFVYFIPLVVLSIVNTHVYIAIRGMISRVRTLDERPIVALPLEAFCLGKHASHAYVSVSSTTQSTKLRNLQTLNSSLRRSVYNNRQLGDSIRIRHMMRMNRLQADRRFALATIFLVAEYLLSWTPYACMALFYLFHVTPIIEHPLLISICAFIAKVSMMINPFIYLLAVKTKEWKTIFCYQRCSCVNCRGRWMSLYWAKHCSNSVIWQIKTALTWGWGKLPEQRRRVFLRHSSALLWWSSVVEWFQLYSTTDELVLSILSSCTKVCYKWRESLIDLRQGHSLSNVTLWYPGVLTRSYFSYNSNKSRARCHPRSIDRPRWDTKLSCLLDQHMSNRH